MCTDQYFSDLWNEYEQLYMCTTEGSNQCLSSNAIVPFFFKSPKHAPILLLWRFHLHIHYLHSRGWLASRQLIAFCCKLMKLYFDCRRKIQLQRYSQLPRKRSYPAHFSKINVLSEEGRSTLLVLKMESCITSVGPRVSVHVNSEIVYTQNLRSTSN